MKNLLLFVTFIVISQVNGKYEANWESLDKRPLPPWYDKAKIGIFIHWGVYSVPAYGTEWFWKLWTVKKISADVKYMADNFKPTYTYQDFAPKFTAEFYDPSQWADIFNASGAKYVVLTSKHHDGFTNWPSQYAWNWNSVDIGPKRDLVGELAEAVRSKYPNIVFGLYYSLYEWFNPLYMKDKENRWKTREFVEMKSMPALKDLVNRYRPELIWSDGDWEAPEWYWRSTSFLAWLFNESPVRDTVVVNDRWGNRIKCKHGSYYTCQDRFNPGKLQTHKWENAMTLDRHSWGFRRTALLSDYLSINDLLTTLVQTISCGGNILVNVGPRKDGMIPVIMEERLRQMGQWLSINGEAIYESSPWRVQNDSFAGHVWYTRKGYIVYALILEWPQANILTLGSVRATGNTVANMLGDTMNTDLQFHSAPSGLQITMPLSSQVTSQWAWVIRLQNVVPVL